MKEQLRPDVKAFFNFETSDLSPECNCDQEFPMHICFVHEGPDFMDRMNLLFNTRTVGSNPTKPESCRIRRAIDR